MSLRVVFRRAAKDELEEAAAWYEDRRRGLGDEFLNEIGEAVERAANHPERHPLVFATYDAPCCGVFHLPFISDSGTRRS